MKTLCAVLASLTFIAPALSCERAVILCAAAGDAPTAEQSYASLQDWSVTDTDPPSGDNSAEPDYWAAWTPVPDGSGMYINPDGAEEWVPNSPEAEAWLAEEQAMYEQQQADAAAVQAYLDERDAEAAESAYWTAVSEDMLNSPD